MALTSTGFMAAPGLYGTTGKLDKLDVSDVLAAILLKDTATLGQIAMKGTVSNIEHFWFEDEMNACTFQAQLCADACLDWGHLICAGTSTRIHNALNGYSGGAILRKEGENPLWRVVSMTGSTTVSILPYGSTTLSDSAMHSSYSSCCLSTTDRWFVVGIPKADTSTYSDDISNARTRRKNYTQVFERGIQIAETREHIALYAIPDELKHQIKLRTYEIKRELNNCVINSAPYETGGAFTPDLETRTMAGLIYQIRDPDLDFTYEDTTVADAAHGALTMTRINDLCKQIYDEGGMDDQSNCCIIVGPYQARVIALLEEQRIRRSSKELVVGSYANKVMTDLGYELPVVIDRFMPDGYLMVLDKNRVRLMPLKGDSWHLEKMAKTGRTQGYQLSGQYTLELKNAAACHGLIQSLAGGYDWRDLSTVP